MNANFMIMPEEARALARQLFISYYPDQDMWFDIAWDVLEENKPHADLSGELQTLPGLAAIDETSSELALMATDFVMFFETFMTKNPIIGQELAKRIQKIADHHSRDKFNRENLLKRFETLQEIPSDNNEAENPIFREFGNLIRKQFTVTQELIKAEHQETRKTVRKPVISSRHRTNYLITLRTASREVVINTGLREHIISLPRVKFELLATIAQINKPSDKRGWIEWQQITQAISTWNNKSDDYIRHRISELRDKFGSEFAELIEGVQGAGYRISTHPENIISDPA